jgi:hypothetical protein
MNVFHGIQIGLGCKLKENITPRIMISAHCMNHYTNLKSKMFLNVCMNIECVLQCLYAYYYHYFKSNVQSFYMYIELNSRSLLKSLELTINHLKVGNFKNNKFIKGPTNVITKNINNISLPQII